MRRERQRGGGRGHARARGAPRAVGDDRRGGRLLSGRRLVGVLLLVALALGGPFLAAAQPAEELEAARAAQAEAARRYRESLHALLPLHEAAEARAAAQAERRRALLAQGLIARADAEAAGRVWEDARGLAGRTRASIAEADALVADAEAARELAALPAPAPGETQEGPTLVRFAGAARFSMAALGALERFFAGRFGRPLPVSARGQTMAHDRLGFDHRNALDVAVHPDTAEGRALMDYLRASGIPFLAFRAARAGVATGAHIHVGEPSGRLVTSGTYPIRAGTAAAGAGGTATAR